MTKVTVTAPDPSLTKVFVEQYDPEFPQFQFTGNLLTNGESREYTVHRHAALRITELDDLEHR